MCYVFRPVVPTNRNCPTSICIFHLTCSQIALNDNLLTGSFPQDFEQTRLLSKILSSWLELGSVLAIFLTLNSSLFVVPLFQNPAANLDISNNLFTTRLGKMCRMSVYEYGELVELRADCHVCNCRRLCRTCYDNVNHLYEYDDDDWGLVAVDDTLYGTVKLWTWHFEWIANKSHTQSF